jgi:predicted kinase
MLVVMIGLPGTGKSTIAGEIAKTLNAVVVNKDDVRRAVFEPSVLDYSAAQDDLCMEMIYSAVGYIVTQWPEKVVIIDGRTYSRRQHVQRLLEVAESLAITPYCIECVCEEEVARKRLGHLPGISSHPAANRNLELYRTLRAEMEPLEIPRLSIDTGVLSLSEAVSQSIEYLKS